MVIGDYDPTAERYWRTVPVASTACYCTGACRDGRGCPANRLNTGDSCPKCGGPLGMCLMGGCLAPVPIALWPKPRYRVKAGRQVLA